MNYICFSVSVFTLLLSLPFLLLFAKKRNGFILGVKLDRELNDDESELISSYNRSVFLGSAIMLLLALPILLMPRASVGYMWLCIWFFPFIIWPMRLTEKYKKALIELCGEIDLEAKHWLYGVLYSDKSDKRIIIEMRNGMGTTVNLATSGGKVFAVFILVCLLMLPASGVVMLLEDYTPVELYMRENDLVAEHLSTKYEINVDEIVDYRLIDDYGNVVRTNGTGLDNLLKGECRSDIYGNCLVSLNPQNDVFLFIVTEEDDYILSGCTDEETRDVFDMLGHLAFAQ